MAPNFNYTNALKSLAKIVAALDLSDGQPLKIESGSLEFPVFDKADKLPYAVIELPDEMSVGSSGSVLGVRNILPVRIWYIRSKVTGSVAVDTLFADADIISAALWRNRLLWELIPQVTKVMVTAVNVSDSNAFNQVAKIEGWPAMAVSVSVNLITEEGE